ncbi:MAG: hypothetical protein ACAI34_00815 [Verrucomicrobium sp.]
MRTKLAITFRFNRFWRRTV